MKAETVIYRLHLAVSSLQHIVSEHCSENRTSGSKDVGVAWEGAPAHYQLYITVLARPDKRTT